ncbi:sigma-54 interaction domain-containing protein [Lysobacter silvisoli]|uniref:Sigma-54-dependent Fis family transcriptional regulator n=1 Tax=Lysobacter silvisoli TaxID=2293254 RepID=A0A371K5R4_9GAMM|nr:sigma-54 dependent transcriptional regulator [Lysobacter silvisoli]RDZ29283.1 sigma-54-dependent Fis family transcriptional regulator [Lysobacter silvisoli]
MPQGTAPGRTPHIRGFLYASDACARIAQRLPVIAGSDSSVLIVGETGTGKEICAQALHYLSRRADGPWVAVNCAAVPVELIESELFGHVKGAFTTAHSSRHGLVKEAEGGTMFLDDIDCLPLLAQGKLLRFLQQQEYRPVGCNTVQRSDVRVIAASNRDLRVMVKQNAFRQDLYFRLNVLPVALPPLRERREDIALLAEHFVRQFDQARGGDGRRLSAQALQKLLAYDWPGNVRELRHVIERSVLLAAGARIEADDIAIDPALDADAQAEAPDPAGESFQAAKKRVVERFERQYIETLLALHHGNLTHAAHAAKKNRRAFFELVRKHQIDTRRFNDSP